MKVYTLCGDKRCCPVVEIGRDVVRIGEDGNRVELSKGQWEALSRKIRSGELK